MAQKPPVFDTPVGGRIQEERNRILDLKRISSPAAPSTAPAAPIALHRPETGPVVVWCKNHRFCTMVADAQWRPDLSEGGLDPTVKAARCSGVAARGGRWRGVWSDATS